MQDEYTIFVDADVILFNTL